MKRNAACKIYMYAYDSNGPKTGDSANLTFYVSKDGGTATALTDSSASELSSTNAPGVYVCDVTAGETDADTLLFSAKSSTSGVKLDPVIAFPDTLPTNLGSLSINGSGQVDVIKIAGTTQTARDIGASVLLSSGTGTGQVSLSSGTVTVGTNNDKTGYGLSSAAVQAIWDALTSALTTVGSIGKRLADNVDVATSTRSTYAGADTAGTTTLLSRIASAITLSGGAVTVGTNNDKTGYGLSSTAVQAIWDAATSALTTVGSIGKWIVDKIDVVLSTRLASAGYTAPDNTNIGVAATQATAAAASAADLQTRTPTALVSGRMDSSVGAMATDVISAAALSSAAADKQAAAIFKLDLSTLTGEALRSLLNATRKQMNRTKKNTGTTKLEIYKEDDTTVAFYQTYTESSGAIVEVNTD